MAITEMVWNTKSLGMRQKQILSIIPIGQIEEADIKNKFCILIFWTASVWKEAGQPLISLLKEDAGPVINGRSPKRLGCSVALFLNEPWNIQKEQEGQRRIHLYELSK